MTTPFSVTGLHSIAFSALLSAALQLGYTDEDDIYDRLKKGSEESYIKPLHYHICDPIVIIQFVLNFFFFIYNRFFKDLGLLGRWLFPSFLQHFHLSSSSTRLIKEQLVTSLIKIIISSPKNQIVR